MTRGGLLGTVLWACLAACIGVGLFFVKHEVKDQERRLQALNDEIQRNQESIHVLRAEWSYLNDPSRLRALAEKHLGMRPVAPAQVASLDAVLKDGITAPTAAGAMLAATAPRPAPPQPTARPIDPPAKSMPPKLAQAQPKPKAADPTRPSAAKPVLAKAAPPPLKAPPPPAPVLAKANAPVTTPARGTRSIVISSPALAQSDSGLEGDGR